MSEWKTYKLGDVAQIIGGGTPSTTKEEYWNGEIGWLTPRDLTGYSFKYISKGERNITEEGLKNSSARLMPEGTVLMTSRAPIGYLAIAGDELCTNQGFKSFIVDESIINNEYLYYLLKSNIDRIKSLGTGSTFAEVSASILKSFEIEIPDTATQKEIAQILTSLDDKIELNLQMNQTLEAMAQAIFKEWFVNFNFPGFDGELVDGLPKGWKMGKLGDISKVIDCLHSKKPERIGEKTGNIFLQLNNILDNGLLDISEIFWISDEDYRKWISRIEISQGDCVITNVGRVGAVARIPVGIKAALGRNMTGIRLKEEYPYPGFLITLLKSDMIKMEIEQKKDIGTILEALNVKNIPNLSFPIPTHQILNEFESIVSKIWDKMEVNTAQNLSLTQIRDSLLPKLMTGKIEVKA
jgi:type I restriction enzyme S subunit